jgi:hypothetical protein
MYDRVIPEIVYEITVKATEYAARVVQAFADFKEKSTKFILE